EVDHAAELGPVLQGRRPAHDLDPVHALHGRRIVTFRIPQGVGAEIIPVEAGIEFRSPLGAEAARADPHLDAAAVAFPYVHSRNPREGLAGAVGGRVGGKLAYLDYLRFLAVENAGPFKGPH